jgi:hypothetical protein
MAVNVYTAMAEVTLFHFAHLVANSVKVDSTRSTATPAHTHEKIDFVSRTAQLSHSGGQIIYTSAIQPDQRLHYCDNLIQIPHDEIENRTKPWPTKVSTPMTAKS